ncbi:protein serine/threonine phosphatase [Solidesulfovibrio fructosivorans JJ]]|uniref:Protein serine/threonine phosphatase n=1 Tax=Solidesulfovibrio fructosivorans JJ] TaxID=596151 RepID=E1JWV6_SOLFR|nr:SpoIIE family protein phosphatase [Solidesulfovibrio fructosivorans]EFL51160.1 protein serine/threonine phosphatase [Solidesulfovibrio fructosivorans JJ]]
MRIRWKLFWLLAALSLTPIVLLRANSQFALHRLADKLAGRVAAQLVAEAETRLRRLVEDHARLLDSRRKTLSVAVTMQGLAAENLLAAPEPPAPDPDDVVTVEAMRGAHMGMRMGMGMGRSHDAETSPDAPIGFKDLPDYFRLSPAGTQTPLPVDPDRITLRLPAGSNAANALDAPEPRRLAALLAPSRRIAALAGRLAHFQITALPSGLMAIYPALAGSPKRFDPTRAPWYQAAMELPGPVWTPPQAEPGTGRIAVAVSCRIVGPEGTTAGVAAILTPLDTLLASVSMPSHFSGNVRSLLVISDRDTAGRPTLMVEAGQKRLEHGHGWHAFVTPSPLPSPDTATLAAMAEDVEKGVSGVRRLTYDGRDSLAAYARTAEGEALMQIASVADVLAASRAVGEDVEGSIMNLFTFGTFVVAAVMLALIFISLRASQAVTRPIRALTDAAGKLAEGDFDARVEATGRDEIGELGRMFNAMAPRLKAHVRLSETLALASEIQHSLLPAEPPMVPGLRFAAASRYCDETGGDYFDFIPLEGDKAGRLAIALGDVSGHGLEAALLMTTARALLRPRAKHPGAPGEVLRDVNRELTRDVYGTGRFMTLFYMEIDPAARTATFARGGHDPAMRYDPATGGIDALTARGMALGVAEEARFETGAAALAPGQVILIGSDGLWEAENAAGEMFGKERTRDILAKAAPDGAQAVLDALFAALDAFRGAKSLDDDVTLVVVAVTDQA